jgi:hypothetical protein
MSHRGWLTQAWNYHQNTIDTLLLSYSRVNTCKRSFAGCQCSPTANTCGTPQSCEAGDAKEPSAVGVKLLGDTNYSGIFVRENFSFTD